MSEETSKGVWAIVGKIAVVLGLILAAIQILKYFSSDGPIIQAQAASYAQYLSRLEIEKNRLKPEEIAKMLPEKLKDKDSVANRISDRANEPIDSQIRTLERGYIFEPVAITVNVSNKGNREAQDPKLELDSTGHYELRRVGELPKTDTFSSVISLGNIRPGNTVSLTIWPIHFSSWREDDVRITHASGIENVEFAMMINGWSALPFRYPLTSILVGFLFIVIAYQLGLWVGAKNGSAKTPSTTVQEDAEKNLSPIEKNSEQSRSEST